jgi:hypothetical protein
VELPAPSPDTPKNRIRYAPRFSEDVLDHGPEGPYTAATVAAFLGWTYDKVAQSYTPGLHERGVLLPL